MRFCCHRHHSPNHVLLVALVALVCSSFFCAKSLWIPASRIGNLHLRAVVLSVTEAVSSYAAETGVDSAVPRLRASFIELSGLSEHSSWDTRFFNQRDSSRREPERLEELSSLPALKPSGALSAEVSQHAAVEESAVAGGEPETETDTDTDTDTEIAIAAESGVLEVPHQENRLSSVYSRENPLSVYFFGDSQVFSLASGLSRLSGRDSPVDIEFLAIHSSGFIRDDFYDWNGKITDVFSQKDYAAAVVMLGMNDYQNFWTDDRIPLKKRTAAWETAYREKCRTIIDTALSNTLRVYWIGMPQVKNATYNDNLKYIEQIHDSVAAEYSPDLLVRVPLRDVLPGKDKPFTDSIELAPGRVLRIMTEDGSHFTVEGGQLVMKSLFDRLVRDFPFSTLPVAHLPE